MTSRFALASILCWALSGPAAACPVCIDLPELTLADRVLGGQVVVLARPGMDDPFRFEAVEFLRGTSEDLDALPEIPFLVSTIFRRKLLRDPASAMLLTYGPQLDEAGIYDGDAWHQTILVTPDRRQTLDHILEDGAGWPWAATNEEDRFRFFASLLTHPDQAFVNTALAEVSRAPYRLIRTVADTVPPGRLRARLTRIEDLPYAPVSILLLGLSRDAATQDYVRHQFRTALERGGLAVDAWAVAGIELDGAQAIAQIARALRRSDLAPDRRDDLILALSVSGTAVQELRPQIAPILHRASMRGVREAGTIAATLYEWRDWTLMEHYRNLLAQDDLEPATRFLLNAMVDGALTLISAPGN
ncbi:MAG: hypothetical protein AAGK37_03900 [Pseudomonadota bacterium]